MEHVVFLDREAIRVKLRRPAFQHTWIEHPTSRPDELRERLEGATIAITNRMLWGGTLGIVGYGALGRAVARWALRSA